MNKAVYYLICMALLLTTVATACSQPTQPAAPAKPAPAPEAARPSTPTPATPPVQPQQPAVQPAKPVEKPTSFESSTYSNDKYSFTIKYPKKWIKKEVSGDVAFWVIENEQYTTDAVWIRIIPKTPDYAGAMKETISQYPVFQGFTSSAKFNSVAAIKLADGITLANEGATSLKLMSYNVIVYCLAVDKGDSTIVVTGVTFGSDPALLKEIAQTISLK